MGFKRFNLSLDNFITHFIAYVIRLNSLIGKGTPYLTLPKGKTPNKTSGVICNKETNKIKYGSKCSFFFNNFLIIKKLLKANNFLPFFIKEPKNNL